MTKKYLLLLIIILLTLITGYFAFKPIKMTGNVVGDLQSSSIQDLGKWIDARQQSSYYAGFNSLIRDDSGRMYLTYCSSGESFNQNYAPDWRDNTNYSTDKVRSQYSSDNGSSWSNANIIIKPIIENNSWQYNLSWKISRNWGSDGGYWEYDISYNALVWYQKNSSNNLGTGWRTIMRTQENVYQGACTNSLIYFKGYYYLYFESYSSPSGILAIHVARSSNPQGPYEVLTDDGWKTIPTNSRWKPVLEPNIRSVNGGEEWLSSNYRATNWSSQYWGAGFPRVTQKDGQIYLYFVDTTYWIVYNDAEGNLKEYGRLPNQAIPYNLLAISSDPTNFENNYENKMITSGGSELWNSFNPKYFPEENKFYNFYFKNINGQNKIIYQTSDEGITWSNEIILGDAYSSLTLAENNPEMGNNIQETYKGLVPLSDKNGYGKLSDLYLTYSKEYILSNAPIGWRDTPNYNWYYGGTDIYGIKVNLNLTLPTPTTPTCTSFTYSPWTTCDSSALQTRAIVSQSPSGCTGGNPDTVIKQCSPPCLESNWQSTDSICLSSSTLTRTWTKIGNCNQSIGINKQNIETISCTYVPNVLTCENFTYSNWSECLPNGVQNRSLVNFSPSDCQAGNPILIQTCNYSSPAIGPNDQTNVPSDSSTPSSPSSSGTNSNYPPTSQYMPPRIDQTINDSSRNWTKAIDISEIKVPFFKKLWCIISNLFSRQGYETCIVS